MVALRGGSSNQTSRFSRLADALPTFAGPAAAIEARAEAASTAQAHAEGSSSSLPSTERATARRNLLGNGAYIGQP